MAKCISNYLQYLRVSDQAARGMVDRGGYHYISRGSYRHHYNRLTRGKVATTRAGWGLGPKRNRRANRSKKGLLTQLLGLVAASGVGRR